MAGGVVKSSTRRLVLVLLGCRRGSSGSEDPVDLVASLLVVLLRHRGALGRAAWANWTLLAEMVLAVRETPLAGLGA